MTRTRIITVALAGSLCIAPLPAAAQDPPAAPASTVNWFDGTTSLDLLGRDTIASSKFDEYRVVPKGVSMPVLTLSGSHNGTDFALWGSNLAQRDQRYSGKLVTGLAGLRFDYNQIPHNMGNDGRSIMTELAPGVWGMNATLRQALGDRVNAQLPTANRTYAFFADLYAPTVAAANYVDLVALRQRGNVEVALGRDLPFDLTLSYMRELKSGTRGAGGGSIRGFSDNIVEVPEPLNEMTQDLGVRLGVAKRWGNAYAGFNHNWYNNRQETLVVDNPLIAFDQAYRAAVGTTPATGGSSRARFIGPPDNSANTFAAGAQFKFARQTRIGADVALGRWLQNAQLYPYTIFSLGVTGSGADASNPASLQFQSLDGKIDTTAATLLFTSRPITGLGLRARLRRNDFDNRTAAIPRIGSFSASPDRLWGNTNLTTEPLGYITASPYSHKTDRLDTSVSYDLGPVTMEGAFRHVAIDRTYREAETTKEDGVTVSAVLRAHELLHVRASWDDSTRTAEGAHLTGADRLPADLAERDARRMGVNVEFMPAGMLTLMAGWIRTDADYKNRDEVAGVAGTAYGLLSAEYDSYTGELDFVPNERLEVSAYYTREDNRSITQAFSGGITLINRLTFEGSDETDTYGAVATVRLVPDKWTAKFDARRQKLDGLMNVSGDPGGSFSLARAAYGGIQDIDNYSDTTLSTINGEVTYDVTAAWGLRLGYWYEKYDFSDAFSAGNDIYPLAGAFFLKANDQAYTAHVVYARLVYGF
jgi:Putative outer membrane beta-barrel porin, MtrB/PioB